MGVIANTVNATCSPIQLFEITSAPYKIGKLKYLDKICKGDVGSENCHVIGECR